MSLRMEAMLKKLLGTQSEMMVRMEEAIGTMNYKFDQLNMNFEELKGQVAYLTSISNKKACELPLYDVPLECIDQNLDDEDEELIYNFCCMLENGPHYLEEDDPKEKNEIPKSLNPFLLHREIKIHQEVVDESGLEILESPTSSVEEGDLEIMTLLGEEDYKAQDMDGKVFNGSRTSSSDEYEELESHEKEEVLGNDNCGVALNKEKSLVTNKGFEKESSSDHLVSRDMVQSVGKSEKQGLASTTSALVYQYGEEALALDGSSLDSLFFPKFDDDEVKDKHKDGDIDLDKANQDIDGEYLEFLFSFPIENKEKMENKPSTPLKAFKKPKPKKPHSILNSPIMTLHPLQYQDGWIDYKIKCKGTSKPFASIRAFVHPEMREQDDSTLQEFLTKVLTIKLEDSGRIPLSEPSAA